MSTTHRERATPRAPGAEWRRARDARLVHAGRRAVVAAATTLAVVTVLVLGPDASKVYAANLIGPLRAPGEPAFIAGHRGDRSVAPENTAPAFEAAFAGGMQVVEVDVQLTADRVAVVIHDTTVDRTTDGTGRVADLTVAQIRALDAGSWYSDDFVGVRVPLLTEFLDLLVGAAGENKKALLELKGFWSEEDVRSILGGIYLRGVQNRVVFASFHLGTLRSTREAAPLIPRVIIQREVLTDPVGFAEAYGAIAILTTSRSIEARSDLVEVMHDAGLGLLLYTLNSEERWSAALAFGVDGIVTDRPSALDSWIAETAPGT